MTGVGPGLGAGLVAAVLLAVVLGAGLGSVLRAVVLARVAAARDGRARALGSAWVNVPATAVAAAVLVAQTGLDLAPGEGSAPGAVALVLVLGLCGGLSTWSTLALELARSVLDGDRRALVLQAGGAGLGLVAGVFGAGAAVLGLALAG